MNNRYSRDLVVLVADKQMESALQGILNRHLALGTAPVSFDIYIHPHRDPGCFNAGHDFLRPFVRDFNYALIVFDHQGSGQEKFSREELELKVEEKLSASGWMDRAAVVVIDPELENWLWSDSPEVEIELGWQGASPSLNSWLKEKGYLNGLSLKPSPPKEAVESALREVHIPRSASIYSRIAEKVSLKRCTDPAFLKLKQKLCLWFSLP